MQSLFSTFKRKISEPGRMEIGAFERNASWAVRHELVVKQFREELMNKVIVDYGCWDGAMLRCCLAFDIPCAYYGLDIEPNIIEMTRRSLDNGHFRVLDDNGHIPDDVPEADTITLAARKPRD